MTNERTPLLTKELQRNDEVVVKIPAYKITDSNNNLITTCLTYEELLPFIIDPGWMRMRKVCFTTCLIAFFVILIAACISSFMSMSGMSCVSSVRVDNASTGQTNVMNVDVASGIFSIVLNSVNGTITT